MRTSPILQLPMNISVEMKGRINIAKIFILFLAVMLLTAGLFSCSEKVTDDFVYDTAKNFEFRDVKYGSEVRQKMNVLTGYNSSKRGDASPVNHASAITTYLYHGKSDAIVPWQQSEKLFSLISNRNPKNKISLIENCGHGFNFYEFGRILKETVDLITKN